MSTRPPSLENMALEPSDYGHQLGIALKFSGRRPLSANFDKGDTPREVAARLLELAAEVEQLDPRTSRPPHGPCVGCLPDGAGCVYFSARKGCSKGVDG